MVQSLWKEFDSLIETSTLSFDDPVILLLGIYAKEMKIYVHKKPCTQKCIAVLFTLGKKIEAMQISISWWVDREMIFHPFEKIILQKTAVTNDKMLHDSFLQIVLKRWVIKKK